MINKKKVLSVITARANSQGLPRKNYRKLNDIPLINYSVITSCNSQLVDITVISSNCSHVLAAAKNYIDDNKLYFVPRPDELAGPMSKNEGALIHAYYYCALKGIIDADIIVNLQPTSPVRRATLIDDCLQKMEDEQADSLLTVSRITPFMWRTIDGKPKAFYDYQNRPMRQSIPESEFLMHDNGSIYITSRAILLDKLCRIGSKPALFEISELEGYQIDSDLDFFVIENILKYQQQESRNDRSNALSNQESSG